MAVITFVVLNGTFLFLLVRILIELQGVDRSVLPFAIPVVIIQAVLTGFAISCWQLLFRQRGEYVAVAMVTSILVSVGVLLLSAIAMVVIPLLAQFVQDFKRSGPGGVRAAIMLFFTLLPLNAWMIVFIIRLAHWSRKLKRFDKNLCLNCRYNIGPTIESGRVMCPECGTPILDTQIAMYQTCIEHDSL